jgi:hypothetical protein
MSVGSTDAEEVPSVLASGSARTLAVDGRRGTFPTRATQEVNTTVPTTLAEGASSI